MEIKDFVKTVLLDIDAAVNESNGSAGRNIKMTPNKTDGNVEFDIAVTVTNEGDANGDAKVKVLGIEAGLGASTKSVQENTSRVKFKIQMDYESHEQKAKKDADSNDDLSIYSPNQGL